MIYYIILDLIIYHVHISAYNMVIINIFLEYHNYDQRRGFSYPWLHMFYVHLTQTNSSFPFFCLYIWVRDRIKKDNSLKGYVLPSFYSFVIFCILSHFQFNFVSYLNNRLSNLFLYLIINFIFFGGGHKTIKRFSLK